MQQAELNVLTAAAAAADAETQQAETVENTEALNIPNGVNLAGEFSVYLTMIVGVVAPALPSVKAIYSEQVIGGLSEATAAVCIKHGWLQDGIGGKYAEEITLAALIIPLGLATHKAVQHDIAALKAKAEAKEKTVEPAES